MLKIHSNAKKKKLQSKICSISSSFIKKKKKFNYLSTYVSMTV